MMLNVALWGGAMAGLTIFLLAKFERHGEIVLAMIIPLFIMTMLDAVNDVVVAFQLGIIR